jgi:hypothetical protein
MALDTATLSAVSALAGSGIGAMASVATTWLTHRFQGQSKRIGQEVTRRERLFTDFVDQASKTYAAGMTHQGLDDPADLVPMYATMNKLRLFATPATVAAAQAVMDGILQVYDQPLATLKAQSAATHDILRSFAERCRAELVSLR